MSKTVESQEKEKEYGYTPQEAIAVRVVGTPI
jgi:hypothetical protein